MRDPAESQELGFAGDVKGRYMGQVQVAAIFLNNCIL